MKRLFGTDGIRGVAGEYPLDPETVRRFGAALAGALDGSARVLLGRDTRESGPWLRDAVAAGVARSGGAAVDVGVITTPGLAHLVRNGGADAAVMISASHNPFRDNGLKVFGGDGIKLSDALEAKLEERILDGGVADVPEGGKPVAEDASLREAYVRALESMFDGSRFSGLRIKLDCANGSACEIAPEVFRSYGATVDVRGAEPDGRNINLDCGSLHLEALGAEVRAGGYDLGIAFDGDADRALAVDGRGRAVDGDTILYLTGKRLQEAGKLRGSTIVATIMSNLWLEQRLGRDGIRLLRTPVGDKYVLERMLAEDAVLGGEQSGHIIFREHGTTGDGIVTGLLLIDALVAGGRGLDGWVDEIEPCPQRLVNVEVRDKPDLRAHPVIGPQVAASEQALAEHGRVVLRYSGTERLARVMVEADRAELVDEHAERLARVIRDELGVDSSR